METDPGRRPLRSAQRRSTAAALSPQTSSRSSSIRDLLHLQAATDAPNAGLKLRDLLVRELLNGVHGSMLIHQVLAPLLVLECLVDLASLGAQGLRLLL